MIKRTLPFFALFMPLIILHTVLRGWEAGMWSGGLLALFSLQLAAMTSDAWRNGEQHVWNFADRHPWFAVPFTAALVGLIVAGFVFCALILWGLGWDIWSISKGAA